MTIADALERGAENAKTGRELAQFFGCNIRAITLQIEKERRDGAPICAISHSENPGYFLAADEEELRAYCRRLEGREAELAETRAALLEILKGYQARKGAEHGKDQTSGDQ